MIKNIVFYATIVLIMVFSGDLKAQTESSVLFVAPSRVILSSDQKTTEINVSNKSSEQRRYDITIVDQVMNEDGLTRRVETFDYSASRMLRFVPRRFTLEPGERQIVRVMATREPELEDGDYHSHILFREVPLSLQDKKEMEEQRSNEQTAQFEIKALYGIAVPIIVQSGQINSDISIGEVVYVPSNDGVVDHLAVEFVRTGNAEASGTMRLTYTPRSGESEELGQQWIPIYREVDRVVKRFPLNNKSLAGGKITLSFVKDNKKDEAGNPEVINKEISF